jgi:endonuclease/exonuclease/phosphatase family metal-dependent hydrolase
VANVTPHATFTRSSVKPTSFKVLTANVHKGFSLFNRRFILQELREAVREVGADIVLLQEVLGRHALHAKRIANWPSMAQYEFLADTIWPNVAYGRNAVYPDGDHGNALLAKFAIIRHHNHDVSYGRDEARGLLHVVLATPSLNAQTLHVICVHFGLTEAHRSAQLVMMYDLIQRHVPTDAPLIVAGDFNDWRGQVHRFLEARMNLREVFAQANGNVARTFPARWPLLRLDRIYVRNVTACSPVMLPRQPWSALSDHAPLAAEIRL